jgi:hypothetical protein
MIFHSDYYKYGFKADEIFEFLAENGINLKGETIPIELPQKWPLEYRLFKDFGKHDAALIMSGIIPSDVNNWNYWDDPDAEVLRKLSLIDAYAKEILALDPNFDSDVRNGKRRWSATEIDTSEKISQEIWREWCKSVDLTWPIPERSRNSITVSSTDAELIAKWRRTESDLIDASEQIKILKTQLREAQGAVDDLRRTVGSKDAIAPHNTHLMKIAIEVQRNYWKDLSTPPKQETLCKELIQLYKLSKAEAQAVERVACPIDRKKIIYP